MNIANYTTAIPLMAVMFFSFASNTYFTTLPFQVQKLGGASSEIGIAFSSYFLCYLLLCLYQNRSGASISHKVISMLSLIFIITLALSETNDSDQTPSLLYIASGLLGLIQASIWSTLMAKVAADGSQENLSKRMGRFNLSWAIPMLASPILAAFLQEKDSLYVSMLVSVLLILMLVSLAFTSFYVDNQDIAPNVPQTGGCSNSILKIATTALLTACIVVMLYKSHLAELMTNKLDFTESDFSLIVTAVNLGSVCIFLIQERWNGWHWRKRWMIAIELIAIITIICVFSDNLMLFLVGGFSAGLIHGFMYGAHQYYCSTLIKNRLSAMSRHEIIQSSGIIGGSLLGGFAGEISFEMPYISALLITAIILLYQTISAIKTIVPHENSQLE